MSRLVLVLSMVFLLTTCQTVIICNASKQCTQSDNDTVTPRKKNDGTNDRPEQIRH
jgi:hypothetical protein